MKQYKVQEFANLIGVSAATLRRWDSEGKLVANRTESNQRFYTEDQLIRYQAKHNHYKSILSYNRITNIDQQQYLDWQIEKNRDFAETHYMDIAEEIIEVGSVNEQRREKYTYLLEKCIKGQVSTILVTDRTRLASVEYTFLKKFLNEMYNVELIEVTSESFNIEDKTEIIDEIIDYVENIKEELNRLK